MNENLDLVEILKDCPKGTKLYSLVHGDVYLVGVSLDEECTYPVKVFRRDKLGKIVVSFSMTAGGEINAYSGGECILFPSRDQRDWSKFKASVKKFDCSTLKPFDKVLVRDVDSSVWKCALFTCMREGSMTCSSYWSQGVPYNDETKHLAGTTNMPDEKYIWWEE